MWHNYAVLAQILIPLKIGTNPRKSSSSLSGLSMKPRTTGHARMLAADRVLTADARLDVVDAAKPSPGIRILFKKWTGGDDPGRFG
jgi:hypothetical protein